MATRNRHIELAARPVGFPRDSDFALVETPVPEPAAGEVLVRNAYMSVDPYMRGRMNDRKSYAPPFQLGQPMNGAAVGQVVKSRRPELAEGSWVLSMMGWREYFAAAEGLVPVDPAAAPVSAYLGVLGIPGFTGWYGLKEIGRPRPGETLVVSAAAGATGSLVGQIGKIAGCRVVGIAGGDDKGTYLAELGFDHAINYRTCGDLYEALGAACPGGIDVYFENVGGATLDAVLRRLNPFSRIPLCGMISQYNLTEPEPGPRYLASMIGNRTRLEGFIISDHMDRRPEFVAEVGGWLRAGRVKHRETIVDGIDNAPRAFLGLLRGENIGKMLVRVGPAPGSP
jgi:NADPH-dependent curcumin reductase CurA